MYLEQSRVEPAKDELATLRQTVREVRSMPDGFALRFDSSTENLMAIAQVIDKERVCCRFLEFQLIMEPNARPFWLEVSGPNDTPQLLLELFATDSI